MADPGDATKAIKMQAISQHWQDIRHLEGMRRTFTSFLSAIFVASIAFISRTPSNEDPLPNYWAI